MTFAKLWPTFGKSVTSVQALSCSLLRFVTVGPEGKETREQEERKSDLGEKKRISGEIRVKKNPSWSFRDERATEDAQPS